MKIFIVIIFVVLMLLNVFYVVDMVFIGWGGIM